MLITFCINHTHNFWLIYKFFSFLILLVRDVNMLSSKLLNMTHVIQHLSFGQKLESFSINGGNPLDSTLTISEEGNILILIDK